MSINRQFVNTHFGTLWPVHNRAFNELLMRCRRHFGGDLDQVLILGIIGERTLTPERSRGVSYDSFLAGQRGVAEMKSINAKSISEITGIPRETVRRKVNALLDRGWVKRREDGTLEVARSAIGDLAPVTESTFDYLAAVGSVLCELASRAGESKKQATGEGD